MVKRKQFQYEEEEDTEEEEEVMPPRIPKKTIKPKEPKDRFELVHQPEVLGIRDNETDEIEQFSMEKQIVDIQNKLDKIIKGSGF